MRLLYITQVFGSGASGTFSRNLVKNLIGRGIDVDVLTLQKFGKKSIPPRKNFDLYKVPVFGRHAFFKFEFPLMGLTKILGVIKRNKYDIIHSQELFPGFLGHIAKLKTKKPHILVKEMASNYPTLHGKIVMFFEKNFIKKLKYDKLISWSKFMVEEFFIKWGVPKEKIEIIPGGIDLNKIPKEVETKELKTRYNINNENVIVITKPLYRTNTYGIRYIILAMKHLLKDVPDTKLLIAGDGVGKSLLENLVNEMRISKNIIFLGRLPHKEALALQRIADVLPHSFVYEPTTSITLLESMASGTPIVCTNSGEVMYLLKDCGILVNPKNPKSIANGIKKALTDKTLVNSLVKTAFRKVKTNYTIERVTKKYINLYSSF